MDVKTGDIYEEKQRIKEMQELLGGRIKKMKLPPTPQQLLKKPTNPKAVGRVGRNDPCPCGSGKKFKKCCLSQ